MNLELNSRREIPEILVGDAWNVVCDRIRGSETMTGDFQFFSLKMVTLGFFFSLLESIVIV